MGLGYGHAFSAERNTADPASRLLILFVQTLIWLVCDPKNMYMQINIWKKWKVFLHSSSSLFFSNPKELTTFFLLLTEKHRISTKTWRNYCFAFTMKQSFLFYGDVMLRETLSKFLWIIETSLIFTLPFLQNFDFEAPADGETKIF